MIRHHVRGGFRLLSWMVPTWHDRAVDYELSPSVHVVVPIGNPDLCWDQIKVSAYEAKFVQCFCEALASSRTGVTLVDCGADIGLFSTLVCAHSDKVRRVLAFEPNSDAQTLLKINVSRLPSGETYCSAVTAHNGHGQLKQPPWDPSPHARFVEPSADGFPTVTIDSLGILGDVALKIDVEGAELEVMRGAAETLRQAPTAIVGFEVHTKVCDRSHVHPRNALSFLSSIRDFKFKVAETGQPVTAENLDLPEHVCNIVAQSC